MIKRYFTLVLFTFFLCFEIAGQSPYQLNWKREAVYLGTGALTSGVGYYISNHVSALTLEEIHALNRKNINGFDRFATFNHSSTAKSWSDLLMMGSHALPASLLVSKNIRHDVGRVALLYGEVYLISTGVTLISKSTTLRTRPLVYNETFDDNAKLGTNARFSFFSGHTSLAAANCIFAAKIFSDYFPDSRLKSYVWGIAITIPALTGYCRVAAGMHYPTDVIVGYGVGAAIGILIPQLHKKHSLNTKYSLYPGIGGCVFIYQL